MQGSGFNLNRTLCAFSGQVGKFLAMGIDSVGKAAGLDEKTTEKTRLCVGQFAAIVLCSTGAPEAALSILSSTSAMPRAQEETTVEAKAEEV